MANFADLTSEGCEKYSSIALENAHQITTAQSIFFGCDGRNTDGSNEAYVWVFDKASAPISGTDFPVIVIEVAKAGTGGAGNFGYSAPTSWGIKFKKGIYILGASTDFGATFTALTSSKMFFHVDFAYEDGVTNPS